MSCTPDTSLTHGLFNWETNDMSNTDENTPYLDRKAKLLGPSDPLNEPLEEFLNIPNHSGEKYYLPGLFHPLCNNQSITRHRSERIQTLGQSTVWLHDSSHDQTSQRNYNGVMDSTKFLTCLRMKRIGQEGFPDAHIRRIHVPNPMRDTVSSIVCTAPWNLAIVLRGFIKRHIKADGQMSASILPGHSGEDKAFVMEFHLPYLVWRDRASGSNREDTRRNKDRSPLRKMDDMSYLTRTAKSDCCMGKNMPQVYLYEAQSSCVVTGYNNSYWTAISFTDTYFYLGADTNDPTICGDNEDMLPYYAVDDLAEATDPLTIDNSGAQLRTLDPRHYFLVISTNRLDKARREWETILHNMSLCVENYLKDPHIASPSAKLTLASTDGHARAVNKSYKWVTRVTSHLKKFQITLEKVIKISRNFERVELAKITGPEPAQIALPYIEEFRRCVNELEIIRDKLTEIYDGTQLFQKQASDT